MQEHVSTVSDADAKLQPSSVASKQRFADAIKTRLGMESHKITYLPGAQTRFLVQALPLSSQLRGARLAEDHVLDTGCESCDSQQSSPPPRKPQTVEPARLLFLWLVGPFARPLACRSRFALWHGHIQYVIAKDSSLPNQGSSPRPSRTTSIPVISNEYRVSHLVHSIFRMVSKLSVVSATATSAAYRS